MVVAVSGIHNGLDAGSWHLLSPVVRIETIYLLFNVTPIRRLAIYKMNAAFDILPGRKVPIMNKTVSKEAYN